MNQFVRELCKQTIQPAVAAQLTQYKLKGFSFDRLVLGRIVSTVLCTRGSGNSRNGLKFKDAAVCDTNATL